MALMLCSGCERHVRETDDACPYCGALGRARTPQTGALASRRLLFAGALVAAAAATEACTSVALYGAPGDPYEPEPLPTRDASTPDTARPTPGPDAGAACFRDLGSELGTTPPTPHRGVCTPRAIADGEAACLSNFHGSEPCKAWKTVNPDCARCVFGPLEGEPASSGPLGAAVPSGPSSYMPNLGSCASIVLGRDDCSVAVAKASVCTAGSCTGCPGGSTKRSCETYAETACVDAKATECEKALKAGYATWASTCQGASPAATFTKVATFFCGSGGEVDAGAD